MPGPDPASRGSQTVSNAKEKRSKTKIILESPKLNENYEYTEI
jgi:hypothetical protein